LQQPFGKPSSINLPADIEKLAKLASPKSP